MTKEEEFVVKVFQRAPNEFMRRQAQFAIQNNNEELLVTKIINTIDELPNLKDWYIQLLGEELYAELQKFKTEG